jgi:hypothetical protein
MITPTGALSAAGGYRTRVVTSRAGQLLSAPGRTRLLTLNAYSGHADVLGASRWRDHAVGADLVAAFRAEQRPHDSDRRGCCAAKEAWVGGGTFLVAAGLS